MNLNYSSPKLGFATFKSAIILWRREEHLWHKKNWGWDAWVGVTGQWVILLSDEYQLNTIAKSNIFNVYQQIYDVFVWLFVYFTIIHVCK